MRREVVRFMSESHGLSQRRACALVGIGRSSCRYASRRDEHEPLVVRLRELAAARPRFGYRRLHVLLRREGVPINHKRLYRLYRLEGLSVRRRKRRKLRVMRPAPLPQATRPNERWAMDFTHDWMSDGRRLRTLNIVDVFTRECLAIAVDTSLPGARVVRELEALHAERGPPAAIVVDNGPEFICRAVDAWAFAHGVEMRFIQPGKPTQNAHVESFNGRFRDECLSQSHFPTLARARVEIAIWKQDYNAARPHSALGYMTPNEFVRSLRHADDATNTKYGLMKSEAQQIAQN